MAKKVIHYPGKQRFELKDGPGEPALLSYHTRREAVVMEYTYVPPAMRGQGIAAILAHDALLEARRLGWKVIADCSYVETYIQQHSEFADVLRRAD